MSDAYNVENVVAESPVGGKAWGHASYGLFTLVPVAVYSPNFIGNISLGNLFNSIIFGFLSCVVGVIIAYAKIRKTSPPYDSHAMWIVRTFWMSIPVGISLVVGSSLFFLFLSMFTVVFIFVGPAAAVGDASLFNSITSTGKTASSMLDALLLAIFLFYLWLWGRAIRGWVSFIRGSPIPKPKSLFFGF